MPPRPDVVLAAPPEIPAFPVLIPLAVVVFAVLLWRLHRREALTVPRAVLAAAVTVYGVGVARSVLLPSPLVVGAARAELPPWGVFVQLVPVVTSFADPVGIVLNVALFVPLGVLLVLLVRRASVGRVVLLGFLLSLGIEIVQLAADLTVSTGRIADVDDLLGNMVGTLIGYAVVRAALLAPPLARLASVVSWPGADRSGVDAR